MSTSIDSVLEGVVSRSPVSRVIESGRAARFVQFCGVGAVGMVVDLAVTFVLLGQAHYLVANGAGFTLAVSWNFLGNWAVTYGRPEGKFRWQYLSYVGLHTATFGLRAVAITALIEAAGVGASVATLVGVAIASVANFVGTEGIFRGDGETWFDVVEAGNHVAHVIYGSRLRSLFIQAGIYQTLFDVYASVLRLCYRSPERTVEVGDATAAVRTEYPTETVSVLHTLEKEREVLEQFVADLEPSDTVLDIGANIGVYTCLAGDIATDVVAIEPHRGTADRCQENMQANAIQGTAVPIALGDERDTVTLHVTNDAIGTQRPEVGDGGGQDVQQWPGDDVLAIDDPDVIKVDVEGAELAVLDGLDETLTAGNCRVVYLEAHSKADATRLTEKLESYGFDVVQIAENEQVYLRGER